MNILSRKSPSILAAIGVAGFVSAVVMSARASKEAYSILEKQPADATPLEKFRALAPTYAPTAALVLISTGCIVGSNRIQGYRYGSLLALYSLSERGLQRWQRAVMNEVSKNKYEKIEDRAYQPESAPPEPNNLVNPERRVLFFDSYTGRYFYMDSVETVRKIINDLNEMLYSEDFVELNALYYKLNIPAVDFGNDAGWHIDGGNIQIDLTPFLYEDRPGVRLSFKVAPKPY